MEMLVVTIAVPPRGTRTWGAGEKVALIVQVAPLATLVQLCFAANCELGTVMLLTVTAVPPLFVRVMVCAAEVVPIDWPPKSTVVVENDREAEPGVTCRAFEAGLAPLALVAVTVQLYCVPLVMPVTRIGLAVL